METEITLAQAQNYAQQILNVFRAFTYVNEVLKKAMEVEGLLTAKKEELKRLEERIEEITSETLPKMKDKIREMEVEHGEKLAELRVRFERKEIELEEVLLKKSEEIRKRIEALKQEEEVAEMRKRKTLEDLEELKKTFLLERRGLEEEITEVRGRLEKAKAELEDLKMRLM